MSSRERIEELDQPVTLSPSHQSKRAPAAVNAPAPVLLGDLALGRACTGKQRIAAPPDDRPGGHLGHDIAFPSLGAEAQDGAMRQRIAERALRPKVFEGSQFGAAAERQGDSAIRRAGLGCGSRRAANLRDLLSDGVRHAILMRAATAACAFRKRHFARNGWLIDLREIKPSRCSSRLTSWCGKARMRMAQARPSPDIRQSSSCLPPCDRGGGSAGPNARRDRHQRRW